MLNYSKRHITIHRQTNHITVTTLETITRNQYKVVEEIQINIVDLGCSFCYQFSFLFFFLSHKPGRQNSPPYYVIMHCLLLLTCWLLCLLHSPPQSFHPDDSTSPGRTESTCVWGMTDVRRVACPFIHVGLIDLATQGWRGLIFALFFQETWLQEFHRNQPTHKRSP